MSRWNKVEQI